jgi:hypothetical protein
MSRGIESSSEKSPSDDTSIISSQYSTLDSRRDVEFLSMPNPIEVESDNIALSRSDIRKSKSKVRSYFKRCKDVLYGHSTDDAANITVKRDIPHSSNTSWYLTAEIMQDDDSGDRISIDHLPEEMKTNQIKEQEASDHTVEWNKSMPLAESQLQVNKVSCKQQYEYER